MINELLERIDNNKLINDIINEINTNPNYKVPNDLIIEANLLQ